MVEVVDKRSKGYTEIERRHRFFGYYITYDNGEGMATEAGPFFTSWGARLHRWLWA